MAGAVQLWKATTRHRRQAGRRLRGLRRRRPPRAREGQRAPHAARRRQRRLREPDQALLARLPRGLLLQAARRLGAARAAQRRRDRALGLPLAAASARRSRRTAPTTRAPSSTGSRRSSARDNVYAELQNAHLPRAGAHPAAARRARDRGEDADRRDRRRPLPPPLRRARARGAPLHPVRRLAQEPRPLEVRDRPLLLQDARGDGARLPRPRRRDAAHARGRRALQRRARARPDPAARLPDARGPRRLRLPRRALRKRPAKALRQGDAGAERTAAVRAEDDQGDGVHRLLPDRLGLHPLRPPEPHQRRPRPRLGRRQPRRLLPRRSPTSTRSATT